MIIEMAPTTSTLQHAAGLILLRETTAGPEVLLGRRHRRMVFMPGVYVFPGGRLEEEDHLDDSLASVVQAPAEVDAATSAILPALARAALRELSEETGLVMQRAKARSLRLIARAITPPGNPRRYDTRFFLGDGAHFSGQLAGDGELEDLRWHSSTALRHLPLPRVTEVVMKQALAVWHDPDTAYYEITRKEELG